MSNMKALTVRPEWADKIMSGEKRIENRSWGQNVRGEIAIHSGRPVMQILGTVDVIDVIDKKEALERYPEQATFISGPLCWVLESPQKVNPISCRGKLGLWSFGVSPDEAKE